MGIDLSRIFGDEPDDEGADLREVELLDQEQESVGERYVDEGDLDDEYHDMHPIKWVADGATSLDEAAAMLEGFASWLRSQESEGWQLDQPVDGGMCFMSRPRPDSGA